MGDTKPSEWAATRARHLVPLQPEPHRDAEVDAVREGVALALDAVAAERDLARREASEAYAAASEQGDERRRVRGERDAALRRAEEAEARLAGIVADLRARGEVREALAKRQREAGLLRAEASQATAEVYLQLATTYAKGPAADAISRHDERVRREVQAAVVAWLRKEARVTRSESYPPEHAALIESAAELISEGAHLTPAASDAAKE